MIERILSLPRDVSGDVRGRIGSWPVIAVTLLALGTAIGMRVLEGWIEPGVDLFAYLPVLLVAALYGGRRAIALALLMFGLVESIGPRAWDPGDLERGALLLGCGLLLAFVDPVPSGRRRRDRDGIDMDPAREALQLVEHVSVGLARAGLDGRWLMVNPRFCALTGYAAEELLTRSFGDITHPDDYARDRSDAFALISGDTDRAFRKKRYLRKDGEVFWAARAVRLVRNEAGEPLWFAVAIEDISDDKAAKDESRSELAELKQEGAKLTGALRHAEAAAWFYSEQSLRWSFCAGLEGIAGRDLALSTTDDLLALIEEPDDRDRASRALAEGLASGHVDVAFPVVGAGGSVRHLRLVGRRQSDFGPDFSGLLLDETARSEEEAERTARTVRDRLRRELAHRLGNVFPSILATIRLSAEADPNASLRNPALENRIQALALVHRALATRPSGMVGLKELLLLELGPMVARGRAALAGPDILLNSGPAESFGIIIHELARNALEHGALRSEFGEVEVSWRTVSECRVPRLHFEWIERGTDPARLDGRRGFGAAVLGIEGSPIIGDSAAAGSTPDGFRYALEVEMEADLLIATGANDDELAAERLPEAIPAP